MILVKLKHDKDEADRKQKIVEQEEVEATNAKMEADELTKAAESSVADANKSLQETLLNISKLKREHLIEVKSLGQPPIPVKITLTGLVIILFDKIKDKGGDIVMTLPQASPGEDTSKKGPGGQGAQ